MSKNIQLGDKIFIVRVVLKIKYVGANFITDLDISVAVKADDSRKAINFAKTNLLELYNSDDKVFNVEFEKATCSSSGTELILNK